MATKKVRVLVPYRVPHLNAGSGDVVELDSADADQLIESGAVEAAPRADLASAGSPESVAPEPLPVRSGPYAPPEGTEERLSAEGADVPYPDPLPVGSGPYEPPEGAVEQLDSDGDVVPFTPLVADPDDAIRPTDEQGNPDYDLTEKTENLPPVSPQDRAVWYDGASVADLKAEATRRNIAGRSSLKTSAALVKALRADDEAQG